MTSPRQRKKRKAFLKKQEEIKKLSEVKEVVVVKQQPKVETVHVEPAKPVVVAPPPVVESVPDLKPKKPKNALVEVKPQDQVVEQVKQEVNTEPKE